MSNRGQVRDFVRPGSAEVGPSAPPVEVPAVTGPLRARILQLADELSRVGVEGSPAPSHAPGRGRRLVGAARRAVRSFRALVSSPAPVPEQEVGLRFNAPLDVAWAHAWSGFQQVLHVFHLEWHGIRAAAGYLPGTKAGIPWGRRLRLAELEQLCAHVSAAGVDTVVFHGWGANMALAAVALRGVFGSRLRVAAVWHGNTAQFVNPVEVEAVRSLVRFRSTGVLDRLGAVKPDFHLVDRAFHPEVLLNVGPRVNVPGQPGEGFESALVPVPLDWRKNLHTNVLAVAAAGLSRVIVTADVPERTFPSAPGVRVARVPRPERDALFALLTQVDLVMNASLSECQPMTALEGLSHRVPCVTGPLALGRLDEHPYQKLVQVPAVDVVGPVKAAVERVGRVRTSGGGELAEMMRDYEQVLLAEARARYEGFLW
jgi:hypothetical protein